MKTRFIIPLAAIAGALTVAASVAAAMPLAQEVTSIGTVDVLAALQGENFIDAAIAHRSSCHHGCEAFCHHHSHSCEPHPIDSPEVFQNAFMAPNNFSEKHLNAYQTNTTTIHGPATAHEQTVKASFIGPIPFATADTIAINSEGQLLTIRSGPKVLNAGVEISHTLMLICPKDLDVLASVELPTSNASATGLGLNSGSYFFLDSEDHVVCTTSDQRICVYAVRNNAFKLIKSYRLAQTIANPDDVLTAVLPDNRGNLWFTTYLGGVGYINRGTQAFQYTNLRDVPGANSAETNSNGLASDEYEGVYVVSDYALYRFTIGVRAAPQATWRTVYDRGSRVKPGQKQQGSGTTPTLFNDFRGRQFVAIADNSDPFFHINVYNRNTGVLLAQQEVFRHLPSLNACNSLAATNHSIIAANNYGNALIDNTIGTRVTEPGVVRVDFNPVSGESEVVWTNPIVSVPSAVSQLSTADGLLYTYAKDHNGWHWAAINFETGDLFAHKEDPFGDLLSGVFSNNWYSGIVIGPHRTAYIGVLGGISSWRAH